MNLLIAKNVTKHFVEHTALDKVNIQIPKGSISGLLGPNGAGKTTLIRIINQITFPDEGEILLDNQPLQASDISNIGYLPEERGLYKKMKVGEQALYLAQLKGLDYNTAITELKKWFHRFEIENWWNKKVEELSKGMAQKIQFIVTVLHKPKLLIFDEPFSGFDPINANLIKDEILKLNREGSTIIFSTHRMESVEELCNHITLLNNSKNILDGFIDDIRRKYKTSTYSVIYNPTTTEIENSQFAITRQKNKNGFKNDLIKIPLSTQANSILTHYLKFSEVKSFTEVIPSINEIFIDAVKNEKNG